MVSAHFKHSAERVATEMAQQIDERQNLYASNRIFAFWCRHRAAKIRNRLLNTGPYDLPEHAADPKVACVAIDNERFLEIWIHESDCICKCGLNCGKGAFAVFCRLKLALLN